MTKAEHIEKARECAIAAEELIERGGDAADANVLALLGICHLKLARYGEDRTRPVRGFS